MKRRLQPSNSRLFFTNVQFCLTVHFEDYKKFMGLYKYYFSAWPCRKYKVVMTKSPWAFSKYKFDMFPKSQIFLFLVFFGAQIFENWFDLSVETSIEKFYGSNFSSEFAHFLSFKKFLQFCFGILWFLRYLQTGQTQKLDQIIYIWLLDSTLISRLIFGKQKLAFHFLEIKFLKKEKYLKFWCSDTSYGMNHTTNIYECISSMNASNPSLKAMIMLMTYEILELKEGFRDNFIVI